MSSVRTAILDDINTNFGLAGKVLYVDSKNGNDSDTGLSPALAKATILNAIATAVAGGHFYKIFVLGGVYTEYIDNVGKNALIGMYGAVLDGNGVVPNGPRFWYLEPAHLVGFTLKNYTTLAIRIGNGFASSDIGFLDLIIEGNIDFRRGQNSCFADCTFIDSTWTYTNDGTTQLFFPSRLDNCTFYNCTDISHSPFGGSWVGNDAVQRSIFFNSTVTFEYDSLSNDAENHQDTVFYNSQIRFSNDDGTFAGIPSSYSSVTSAAEMRAKRDLDMSITTPSTFFETCLFSNPDFLDAVNYNLFVSEDTPSYISKLHTGDRRKAIYIDSTQMTAPTNGSVSSGYAESTAAPGAGIEFICDAIEFNTAKKIKRIHAIIDIGQGGEIMSSQAEDVNQRIIDVDFCSSVLKTASELDASPEAYTTYELGIVGTTLAYDDVGVIAKSCKLKFTLKNEGASTDFGEVKVYQIIIETEDYFFFDEDTDVITQYEQLGSANGNMIGEAYECVLLSQPDSEIDAATTGAYKIDANTNYTYDEIVAIAAASPGSGVGHIEITYSNATPSEHNIEKVEVEVNAEGKIKTLFTFNN